MFKNKIPLFIVYYILLIYLETVYRILCIENFFSISIINTLIYLIPISFILNIISSFTKHFNKVITYIIIFIISFWFVVETIFKKVFGVFFSIKTINMVDNLTSFTTDVIRNIFENIIIIIILFIPFIIIIILNKKINFNKINKKSLLLSILVFIISITTFKTSLLIKKNENNSLYKLYYEIENNELYKEKVGVTSSVILEIKREIFGFSNCTLNEVGSKEEKIEITDKDKVYYNNLNIDFNKINSEDLDSEISAMNNYFMEETGTKKNDYTGYFKGKNLILFMAESFNSIAVSKELTPTLYKLANSSFVFENFYSPVILSTIGGEFQELTGLYPDIGLLSNVWRKGTENYKFGIANVFKNMGYSTYAYHDNQYNFQNRDKYLNSIGFDNYVGCKNGLESKMNCNVWPESDVEMINATYTDYINNDDPFMVYYATVSGHMAYNWENAMSKKHKDMVINTSYSNEVKAYLAAQIELDLALQTLIEKLEEAGKLDNTVIALVGDHYPYALSLDNINEISSYKRDKTFEINRSNFILWNNNTETVIVNKVGSQIDVLPTIFNIFGADYDSRLIIGKDILSDNEGLAIFANQSWISDYGRYDSRNDTFYPSSDSTIPEDYIVKMNEKVSNKVMMSKLLLKNNYYNFVLDYIEEIE